MKDAVNRKAATSCGGVHQRFMLLRVEHLDAHVDHVARGEVLAFFALAAFADEVFKRLIHHIEVGVK